MLAPKEDGVEFEALKTGSPTFAWVEKTMKESIVEHLVSGKQEKIKGYKISNAYKVVNPNLLINYEARKQEIRKEMSGDVPEKYLFHGTTNALDIAKEGFKIDKCRTNLMFGIAIYFSHLSSKCSQYTFGRCNDPCTKHKDIFCTICTRSMLICKIAMGNIYDTKVALNGKTEAPAGFHSVHADPKFVPKLRYPEYAVYHNYQAYPEYLVQYTIEK